MNQSEKTGTSLETVELLLRDVSQQAFVPKEKTFFSIGGLGYYENPTSDVLAFFLTPEEQHGFGTLFLQAFFECMPDTVNYAGLDLSAVTISREERINGGDGRIDVYVRGDGWSLIIENKIWHWAANDFAAYGAYAQAKKSHLVILAPRLTDDVPGWKSVTYRDYCAALRRLLPALCFNSSFSKWQVLAHEFIMHLEEEIYGSANLMTQEQITLVENNLSGFDDAIKLRKAYSEYLCDELSRELSTALPGQALKSHSYEWGPECQGENWAFSLEVKRKPKTQFRPLIWLRGLTSQEMELTTTDALLNLSRESSEEGWECWSAGIITDRGSALNELCRLAAAIEASWRRHNIRIFAVPGG